MREFLNEYMTSLTSKRREKIQDILAAAQVGKVDLDQIMNQLVDLRISSPITIGLEAVGGIIEATKFDATYNDAFIRLQELYQASNLVSLLLDSHTSILTSEIKALEDELNAIEKAIDNYAFTLADSGFYDYSFSETFSDLIMNDTKNMAVLSDRDGINFSPNQICYVNTNSGVLTLDPSITTSYSIIPSVIGDNCLNYATSNTPLIEAFNKDMGSGWRASISVQKPISTSLVGSQYKGAQVKIRGQLTTPSPCDSISITPLADSPVYLLNLELFREDEETVSLIAEPIKVDQPIVLSFPLQVVDFFEFTLSQPVYSRNKLPSNASEEIHRKVYNTVKSTRLDWDSQNKQSYTVDTHALKRVFSYGLKSKNANSYIYKSELPKPNFSNSNSYLSITKERQRGFGEEVKYKNNVNNVLRRMIHERLFPNNREVLNDRYVSNFSTAFLRNATKLNVTLTSGTSQEYPRINVENPIDFASISIPYMEEMKFLDYNYNLGIKEFQIGTGVKNYKGVFVSKQLPSFTDVSEVKINSDYTNYELIDSPFDLKRVTNIEYSVTNKTNPVNENDWLPIIPTNENDIKGERLFFNEAGIANPRFYIAVTDLFAIYRNGIKISNDEFVLTKNEDNTAIKSIRLPVSKIFLTDIYAIDYTPYGNATVVNFKDKGFDDSILASAFDELGGGQTFTSTGDSNIVTLAYDPYIDYTQAQANGVYSEVLGFTGTYQPITVILSDGTVAKNFTNYIGITQTNLADVDSDTVGYLHSDNKLIFNQPLTDKFTVYYQYLPGNIRVRIVMRCNIIEYVSPIVSSYQLKAKTKKANPKKVF
jgi:hypothetical protein